MHAVDAAPRLRLGMLALLGVAGGGVAAPRAHHPAAPPPPDVARIEPKPELAHPAAPAPAQPIRPDCILPPLAPLELEAALIDRGRRPRPPDCGSTMVFRASIDGRRQRLHVLVPCGLEAALDPPPAGLCRYHLVLVPDGEAHGHDLWALESAQLTGCVTR